MDASYEIVCNASSDGEDTKAQPSSRYTRTNQSSSTVTEECPTLSSEVDILHAPNAESNYISPFSSPSSKSSPPIPSVSVRLTQDENIPSECSDLDEDEGYTGRQNHCANSQSNFTSSVQAPPALHHLTCFNQGSSSTFSPLSSPASSPRSEGMSAISSKHPSSAYSGTFLHPGTNAVCAGDREKGDRIGTSNPGRFFVHPSVSEGSKNGHSSVDPNTNSVYGPIVCGPGHRIQSQTRVGSRTHTNLLKKLMCREVSGIVRKNAANPRDPQVRFFTRLPARLAFCLRDAIPHSAIEAGHIFLGFSKCGQFLLSYTQTETDVDLVSLVSTNFHYHYRLHWWLFVPYRRAKKVAEVTLFNNASAAGNLHISFCQWPKDNKKVLVFGCQIGDNIESMFSSTTTTSFMSSARTSYITVTAIPSLDACRECVKVAANYEEDEMAAAWNSCVRLSCLDHGMTVHTSFDLVPPYPKFEPRVSMKRDSWVIINSGNFLHAMHFELEDLKANSQFTEHHSGTEHCGVGSGSTAEIPSNRQSGLIGHSFGNTWTTNRPCGLTSPQYNSFSLARWSELRISVSEFNSSNQCSAYSNVAPHLSLPTHPSASPYYSHTIFSPTQSQYSPSVHAGGGGASSVATTDSSDCESECSSYTNAHSYSKHSTHKKIPMNPERLERVANFVDQLSPPQLGVNVNAPFHARRLKRIHVYSSVNAQRPNCEADNTAFEMSSAELQAENTLEPMEEGNKRKRLANAADKAYEVTDDNFDEDSVQEKFSTFRRKRLAEKKYEFTDEDSENIPLPKLRSQQQQKNRTDFSKISDQQIPHKMGMNVPDNEDKPVLRALNANQPLPGTSIIPTFSGIDNSLCEAVDAGVPEEKLYEYVPVPELLSPGGMVNKKETSSCGSSVINASPRSQHGVGGGHDKEPLKFHAKFTRRFIEMDDEMVSVMSGIELEDDECVGSQTGYHSALPLEVHGSGYQAMAMISNSKAEKLMAKCCKVAQYSMDVELFCHDMAQKLCAAAGKKYWFCNDYDVELVDIDPDTGDVICVAVVLVTATVVTKSVSQTYQKLAMISSLQRHLHQGGFQFCWNMDTGNCHVINSEPLKEVFKEPNGLWHPAKNISMSLQRTWCVLGPNSGVGNIRSFTNDSVIRGTSLKTIVDTDHLVAIILDDLD